MQRDHDPSDGIIEQDPENEETQSEVYVPKSAIEKEEAFGLALQLEEELKKSAEDLRRQEQAFSEPEADNAQARTRGARGFDWCGVGEFTAPRTFDERGLRVLRVRIGAGLVRWQVAALL